MLLISTILIIIVIGFIVFIHHPKFGKLPDTERLERIINSPNYLNGRFQNLSHTPDLTEGVSYYRVLKDFLFKRSKRIKPGGIIPSTKTNLMTINPDENIFVWFGHSSYYLQLDGKKILVDPVFSGSASPVAATTRSYKGSDIYTISDIPEIDYLFITHDHWDHLDYTTLIGLKPKIKKVISGLGTGAHLEHWGYKTSQIYELDWHQDIILDNDFKVYATTARHFSGRGFRRNQTLWVSFVLITPRTKIFIGGDSGFDSHFKSIGASYGPFDLAILECGQYNNNWKYIHMMPEEVVQASVDLNAAKFIPVHWSKFSLAQHDWDEPVKRVTQRAQELNVEIFYPMIGQKFNINQPEIKREWWNNVT